MSYQELPKIKPDQLVLSGDRHFFTVQGEGVSIGRPAVFLRLHYCNLRCSWCDTPYAVFPSDPRYYTEPKAELLQQVFEKVSQYPCKRLVITGGEPLLQKSAIENLMMLFPEDWAFEIETNGTQLPTEYIIERGTQFNVSPKLENSGNPLTTRFKPEVLEAFNDMENAWFKFVVIDDRDLKEIQQIVSQCSLDESKIILMPEGTDQDAIAIHGANVAELAKELGWMLLPRLQIMLWGAKRAT